MEAAGLTDVVGREGELELLETFLSEPGRARALLIEGEPGIGKTTLWGAGVEMARAGGWRVLACAPAAGEVRLSFAALADVLGEVGEAELAGLPEPQRAALEVALLRRDAPGGALNPRAVAAGVLGTLRLLARRGPVLVALDDAQWLDDASAGALAFAVRRLSDLPVAVVLTLRTEPRRTVDALDVRAAPIPVETVTLGPLSLGAVQRLLHVRIGVTLPRPVLRRLHETSAGNPFYALELARAIRQAGPERPGEPLPVPATIAEVAGRRLDSLPERALRELLVLAAGGRPDPEAVAPAVEAGVLEWASDDVRFVHPLLAAAVYARASPPERRAVHARLSRAAATREERARHLAVAAEPPDASTAEALAAGAEDALARGAPGIAGELLAQAVRFTPPEDEAALAARSVAAADALNRAGDWRRGHELACEALARVAPGPARAGVLVWLADYERSAERSREALREARADSGLRAGALNALSEALLASGDVQGALASAEEAAGAAREAGDRPALVRALDQQGYLGTLSGDARARSWLAAAIELEREAGEESLFYGPAATLAAVQLWADELDEARRTLCRQAAAAAARGDDSVEHGLLVHLLKVEWRAGDLAAVRRHAEKLVELHGAAGWTDRGTSGWALAAAAALAGDLDDARRHARQALSAAEASENRILWLIVRALLGHVELAAGDAEAAAAQLEELPELVAGMGVAEPGQLASHADELEALVASGRLDRADRRVAEVEELGRRLDRPRELVAAARGRALLLAARGELEQALDEAEEALVEGARLPVPLERARSLLLVGTLRRRLRRRAAARAALEQALAQFEACGAGAWADRARDELGRVGGRAPSGKELTPAERRVAELAAEGLPTKRIAASLFVSPKTVEGHLSRVYEKLGVHSRAELARLLASSGAG